MAFPNPFPFRALKTMRAAMFLKNTGKLEAFTREAFALYWEEGGVPKGLDETDEDGPVSEAARRVGADPGEVLAGASDSEAKEAHKAATDEAVGRLRGASDLRGRRNVLGQRPDALRRKGVAGRLRGRDAGPLRAPARGVNMVRRGSDKRQGSRYAAWRGRVSVRGAA